MLFEKIKKLKDKYEIEIPSEYNDFILNHEMYDYYGKFLKVNGYEYEIGHFLKEGESSSEDLFDWYLLTDPKYKDYLTIAFCVYDEQIAIKVRGADKGKVVLLIEEDETEEVTFQIIDVASNFSEFISKIF